MGDQFFRDRERGKEIEEQVAFLLRTLTHHKHAEAVPVGLFTGYDIIDPETGRRFEVKADWRARDTDQFAVEHHYGPDPSGVATTKADDWAFWDGEECILISVDALVGVIQQHGCLNEFRFRGPGDPFKKTIYGVKRWMIRGAATYVWRVAPYLTSGRTSCASPPPRSPGRAGCGAVS